MIRLSTEGTTMSYRSLRLLAALPLCLSAAAFGQAPDPAAPAAKEGDKPAAAKSVTVNGKTIPKSRLDFIVKQRAAQGQPDNEQTRQMIMDNLITQEVVAQRSEEHTSELQSHRDLHSFPTRRSSDLARLHRQAARRAGPARQRADPADDHGQPDHPGSRRAGSRSQGNRKRLRRAHPARSGAPAGARASADPGLPEDPPGQGRGDARR